MGHFIHTDGYAYWLPASGALSSLDNGTSYVTIDYDSGPTEQFADMDSAGLFWRIVGGTPVQDGTEATNGLYVFIQLRSAGTAKFEFTVTDTEPTSDLYLFGPAGGDLDVDPANYAGTAGSWFDYATGAGHSGTTSSVASFWHPYLSADTQQWRLFFHSGSSGEVVDFSAVGFRYLPEVVAGGLAPLRQWPRDDGLRSNPKRGGNAGPVSRQGSLRRGPRGNYK